ncbi:bifunctional metallophosphatase/5'-nucleotidase [Halalkalibacter urbisdiaboli]|uniref:bifunctional metallophosphatase/5'-nucleotidase n=1 Tax=Halalkalibacter urbisdiaboli TaxID=1960589 RepID=UPI000B43181B|nr:5'-nucleotidase C-terminal domain-containing protein [Halalkalibacter urbisdiaboli]
MLKCINGCKFQFFLLLILTTSMVIGCSNESIDNALSNGEEQEKEEKKHVEEETTITILHDTHFHGSFGDDEVNLAKYVDFINSIRYEKENVLFVGAGDEISPSLMAGLWNGEHMIEALNASGLDVTTFGNHEFDYGPENLEALVSKSEFQWVSANIIDKQTGDVFAKDQGARRYIIKDIDGVNLGITGLAPKDMGDFTSLGETVEEIDFIEAMKAVVPEMKDAGADIILVLSHLANYDAEELADEVNGIDIIVGDHNSKVNDEPKYINDTIVSFAGDEYDYLGEINIQVTGGKIADWSYTLHTVEEHVGYNQNVQTIIDRYNKELEEQLEVEIGKRTVEFDTRLESIRYKETAVGNFIADTIRDWANADVAIQNGGGLRGNQVWGANESITRKEIQEILPFRSFASKLEVTGELLLEVLDYSVSNEGEGAFLQVSGIEMKYDPSKDAGERIVEIKINGEPLDVNKTYTLATNNFLHTGGDGYSMLLKSKPIIVEEAGPLLSNLIIKAIEEVGVVSTEIEGRIVKVDQ